MKKTVVLHIVFVWLWVILPDVNAGLLGDVDLDGKIGLTEAVTALQVTSGTRVPLEISYVMVWRSAWEAGQTYRLYDVVQLSGSSYICLQGHTSDHSNQPPDGTPWDPIALKGDPGEPSSDVRTNETTYNTSVGIDSLMANTTGYSNTAYGYEALHSNTEGYQNTAAGTDALYANTTGNDNTSSGAGSLQNNTEGNQNTAHGSKALFSNMTGSYNTAIGTEALSSNETGDYNTASGHGALWSNASGWANTANGASALASNTGDYNTASGASALHANTTGYANTANGTFALLSNTTGYGNTAVGYEAGYFNSLETGFIGNQNIYLGYQVYPTSENESNTIRIGNANQSQTHIAGIFGSTSSTGAAVYVDSNGKLGIANSSRRYKEDVQDMGEASSVLMRLRPVTFYYRPEYDDGEHMQQYGLIAEEVAAVHPGLVLHDPKTGEPRTVYYHHVNAMLLNEVQKQQRKINDLEERLAKLEALLDKISNPF